MKYYLLLPLIISLIHLIGAYFRYLPFSKTADESQKKLLFSLITVWNLATFFLQQALALEGILDFSIYKKIVLFGVLPYFLFSFFVLKGRFYQHVFILGMQHIFSFSLHSLSSILTLVFFSPALPAYMTIQSGLHLAALLLLMPFAIKWFSGLYLPFNDDSSILLNYSIAFIPLLAASSHWYMVFSMGPEAIYVYISRLMIVACFFLFYRYCWLRERELYEKELQSEEIFFMKYQIEALSDYTQQIMETQNKIIQIRHDSKHWIRMLRAMLESNDYVLAKKILQDADSQLDRTRVYFYCQNPAVNASLSVYFSRAKKYGIRLQYSVNIPAALPGMDNDVAILVANLLDNAIHASLQGDFSDPSISLEMQTKGSQIVLCMKNNYTGRLVLDEDGFPFSTRRTMASTKKEILQKIAETEKGDPGLNASYLKSKHGIGYLSIKSFIKKYKGYYDITQQKDMVTVFIYWKFRDEAEEEKKG